MGTPVERFVFCITGTIITNGFFYLADALTDPKLRIVPLNGKGRGQSPENPLNLIRLNFRTIVSIVDRGFLFR